MDTTNQHTITSLGEELILRLEGNRYSPNTVQLYREHVNRLQKYMEEQCISVYSPDVANSYYKEIVEPHNYDETTKRFFKTVIRRLNDIYEGRGFVYSVPRSDMSVSEQFSSIVEAYLDHCAKTGNSIITIKTKERMLHGFFCSLEKQNCHALSDISAINVMTAAYDIGNTEYYPELRDFLGYLLSVNAVTMDYSTLVPKHRRGFRIPPTYTIDEIRKVENSVDTTVSPGKRDLAIILLASRLGVRAGDIAALRMKNLDFVKNRISFIQHKTGNLADLYIIPVVKTALMDYIFNERPRSTDDHVFLKSFAPYAEISYSVVSFTVKKHMQRAGIDVSGRKNGPHSLRSSLATSMVNDGISYETVRMVLGHESPNAIKNYAKIDIEILRQCSVEILPPSGALACFLKGGAR